MSSAKLRKEKDCLNCGHTVEEHFCPHCGQENIVVKEDAFHMVSHAIADYFHFEHKFFGTLRPLMLKPGQLTKEYVAGKRVSFIHPIRLYIFVSIVFFLFILGGGDHEKKEKSPKKAAAPVALDSAGKDSVRNARLKEVENAMKYVPLKGGLRDSALKEAKKNIEEADEDEDVQVDLVSGKTKTKKKGKWGATNWAVKDSTVEAYEKRQNALPKAQRDGFLKHYFTKRSIELDQYDDPEKKFTEDLLHNIPKMMFLLLPMFALILKLVYINKQKYYYEHLIYSFHLHSAIFLSVLITMLLKWLFGFVYDISGWLEFLCTIYIIWYVYRSLRTFYNSTRWVTLLKIGFLTFCYTFVFALCFMLIIAISFIMV